MQSEPPAKRSSPKRTPTTTRLSADGEAERLKRFRALNTTRVWRSFRTSLESVPAALQSQNRKLVTLADLASTVGVPVKRLLPALEHGYLKIVSVDPPLIYEPPPGAIEWLKLMFQPLSLRPFIGSEMVAELEGIEVPAVRQLCLDYNIPIYSDPVFGELMSISSFYRFHEQMHHQRQPSRFDRQAILAALMHTVNGDEWRMNMKPHPFSRRLELEVRRISRLEEPARTDAALRLWTAYEDGKKVAECVAAARGETINEPKAMKQLQRMLEVEAPPESSQPQTPSQD